MQIIGITGGIGSGKSTIARELANRGYAVYDCDHEAKRIVEENESVRQQIIALLGEQAFVGQRYNTVYVSQRVFAESQLLQALNGIIHPVVMQDILHQAVPILFVESAILYESGFDRLCDVIVVVDAPEEVRIERTIARDFGGKATPENINKVRARMCAQRTAVDIERIGKPVITLLNDGKKSISELAEQIIALL